MKTVNVSAFGVPVFFDEYRRVAVRTISDAGVSASVASRQTWTTGRGCESRSHECRNVVVEYQGRSVCIRETGDQQLDCKLSAVLGAVSSGSLWMVGCSYPWDEGEANAVAEVLGPDLTEAIRALHEMAAGPARADAKARTSALLAKSYR
jgi:hypothetical protein